METSFKENNSERDGGEDRPDVPEDAGDTSPSTSPMRMPMPIKKRRSGIFVNVKTRLRMFPSKRRMPRKRTVCATVIANGIVSDLFIILVMVLIRQ